MCEDDDKHFICVLIDEVESIAISRESTVKRGESHDSLRATNALLTGLDRCRRYSNVIFLFTSNIFDSLDSAFVDRCGFKVMIAPPSAAAQYEILRDRIQKLANRGYISMQTPDILPRYYDAEVEYFIDQGLPGSRLYKIVKRIQTGGNISGRSLTQLPERAILQFLREDECTLCMALDFIERAVLSEESHDEEEESELSNRAASIVSGFLDIQSRKRRLMVTLEEDRDLELLENFLTTLQGDKNTVKIEKYQKVEATTQ